MPRAFNESETDDIRRGLRDKGRALFAQRGVLKTSIEEITNAVGIAKGSFYKFYESKEVLFFDLLEDSQNVIRAPLLADHLSTREKTRARFETLARETFEAICAEPLIQFMGRRAELQAIMRKVPAARLQAHEKDDQAFLDTLITVWRGARRGPARDVVAARMSMLVLVSLNTEFLGARLFPHAADAAIAALADCFFKS